MTELKVQLATNSEMDQSWKILKYTEESRLRRNVRKRSELNCENKGENHVASAKLIHDEKENDNNASSD